MAAYELYRTSDPARAAAGDFRRLALAAVVPVTDATWQGPAGAQFAVLDDLDVRGNERWFYTVVARGPGVAGAPGRARGRPPWWAWTLARRRCGSRLAAPPR